MKKVAMVWKDGRVSGNVKIKVGALVRLKMSSGGSAKGSSFSAPSSDGCRLEIEVKGENVGIASPATIVHVLTKKNPFSFFLRDVTSENPIFIPAYGAAVVPADDGRAYDEIDADVRARGRLSYLQQLEAEPEESYGAAAAVTRDQVVPTLLGLSRDIRIFEVSYNTQMQFWGNIRPRFHFAPPELPEANGAQVSYGFEVGRGAGCVNHMERWLEDGQLPILYSRVEDGGVEYNLTFFTTLEKSKLIPKNHRGTHYLVAGGHATGHMFTPEQQKNFDRLQPTEENRPEETVMCVRIEVFNPTDAPRYGWLKNLHPSFHCNAKLDGRTGFSIFTDSGRVFGVSRINGEPVSQSETAIPLQPRESATLEFFLPHQPISKARAAKLAKTDFDARKEECRAFWRNKLDSGGKVTLPEKTLNDMTAAGLLHLDMISYGIEPNGPVAATIGNYSPIGSESSPIIQFFDSMGWHKVARRALQYFLEQQHDDGFIQNFGNYMLETGPALWSMGEHYRYTRDDAWVRRIKPKLLKALEYMLAWRGRNMKPELRGVGYGMMEGKTADPVDPFHAFMLNGYAYMGMQRAGEMLRRVSPKESKRWFAEAEALKKDVRKTFFNVMGLSPVVALSDGTWVPSAPPWGESIGALILHTEPKDCFTHGSVPARDSLLGPLYLVFQEVIEADEPAADFLLNWHAELCCTRNLGLSQPYYCRNPFVHLERGETKAFLKAYYAGLTSLADRGTFTWWEHFFHASVHKTHEEGWFLMQTRWMLWREDGTTLRLLRGIPRDWLADGKRIALDNVATYFGPMSLEVESSVETGTIEATVTCRGNRRPKEIAIRLPHPQGKKAASVEGGAYDGDSETVRITQFKGRAKVIMRF